MGQAPSHGNSYWVCVCVCFPWTRRIFTSTLADMETARRLCAADQPKASAGSGTSGTNNNSSTSQRSKQAGGANNLHIIRLRGLPFSATPADIKAFLTPIELPDGINSIQMVRHPDLRPTGEAYVHLSTEAEVMQALNKHKQTMGKRYIEVGACTHSSCLPVAGWRCRPL